jgi:uncharacterized membrane protein HdeD (DUF308 family)
MPSFLLLILGLVDVIGGMGIIFSSNLFLQQIATYVGIALLIKGIWSVIMGLA